MIDDLEFERLKRELVEAMLEQEQSHAGRLLVLFESGASRADIIKEMDRADREKLQKMLKSDLAHIWPPLWMRR